MFMQRFYFKDLNHAKAVLRESMQGAFFCMNKTLAQGFIDLYAMDESHAERIAEKYNAKRGEIIKRI
jgi:hypothetical protein